MQYVTLTQRVVNRFINYKNNLVSTNYQYFYNVNKLNVMNARDIYVIFHFRFTCLVYSLEIWISNDVITSELMESKNDPSSNILT